MRNRELAGKARSKCVTDVGHKVQLPLGPSTGDASANWDLPRSGLGSLFEGAGKIFDF